MFSNSNHEVKIIIRKIKDKKFKGELFAIFPETGFMSTFKTCCYSVKKRFFDVAYYDAIRSSELGKFTDEGYDELIRSLTHVGYNNIKIMKKGKPVYM